MGFTVVLNAIFEVRTTHRLELVLMRRRDVHKLHVMFERGALCLDAVENKIGATTDGQHTLLLPALPTKRGRLNIKLKLPMLNGPIDANLIIEANGEHGCNYWATVNGRMVEIISLDGAASEGPEAGFLTGHFSSRT